MGNPVLRSLRGTKPASMPAAVGVATMRITGQVSSATVARQADKYKRFAEQCRELAKPVSGQLKETLEEMAKVWDDLAQRENERHERVAE